MRNDFEEMMAQVEAASWFAGLAELEEAFTEAGNENLKMNDVGVYTIIQDKWCAAKAFGRLGEHGTITMSISQIAELARLDRKTVAKSLEKLEKMHLLYIERSKGNAIKICAADPEDTDYFINPDGMDYTDSTRKIIV